MNDGLLPKPLRLLLPWLVFAAIFFLRIIRINDPDVFLHIRSGWWILQNRAIPATDPFALFSLGQPWVNHQWLAQVSISLLSAPAIGGLITLSLARAALLTVSFALLHRAALNRGASQRIALLCLVFGSMPGWMFSEPRPYIFTYLGLAWISWAWSAWKSRGSRAIFFLPAIMLPWANSHGGATSGMLFFGALVTGEWAMWIWARFRQPHPPPSPLLKISGVLLATILCSFISPHGWRILLFPFQVVGKDILEARIFEWNAPTFEFDFLAYWAYLAIFLTVCVIRVRSLSLSDAIASAGFIYMSLTARRHIPLMIYVTLPVLASQLTHIRLRHHWLKPLAAAGMLVFSLGWAQQMISRNFIPLGLGMNQWAQPRRAVDFLLASPLKPNLFHDYNWGGYLIHRLSDPWKAFIDGRVDIYGPQGMAQYTRIMGDEPQWQPAFKKYEINTVMLDYQTISRLPGLARQLWDSPEWAVVYFDELCFIVARRSSIPSTSLEQMEYRVVNPAWSTAELSRHAPSGPTRQQAYEELQRALRENAANLRAMDFLSNLLGEDGQLEEAEAICRKMIEIQPRVVHARHRLARILDNQDRLDEAEEQYRRFLKSVPNHAGAILRLGTIEERRGDNRKALKYYRRALELDPSDAAAREGIERVSARR